MSNSLFDQLASELDALKAEARFRSCPGTVASSLTAEGSQQVSFATNDYLGLSNHPDVVAASHSAALAYGVGVGASRLLATALPPHTHLEQLLAEMVQLPSSLLFPSGYQANLGAITALAGPDDLIVADRAVHASLIDAFRLSRAKLALYPHLDVQAAERHLERLARKARRRLLVTESLFSMDGDAPSLVALRRIASAHGAALYVDEAHALGALGPDGRGLCAEHRVTPDILVGTLGKAFGASGAFVAGPAVLTSFLANSARSFIFTTCLPFPVVAAAARAVQLSLTEEGRCRRQRLGDHARLLRSELRLPPDPLTSPILPLLLGDNQRALDLADRLHAAGLHVPAIRPPTVRPGTARLRISLSAAHTPDQLHRLSRAILQLCPRPSADPSLAPIDPSDQASGTWPRQQISGTPQACTTPACTPSLPFISSPATPFSAAPASPKSAEPASSSSAASTSTLRGLFLVGTDTGVGKTAVAQALLHHLSVQGRRPVPFKPVETGTARPPSDSQLLSAACHRPDLPLSVVCPFSFLEPIAPAAAARAQGMAITTQLLCQHAAIAQAHGDFLLVESAGGLLSPYGPGLTPAELAQDLRLPLLLVARNSLGTVNHVALAVSEIRRRGLPLIGILLVQTTPLQDPAAATHLSLIADAVGTLPLGTLPYISTPTPEALAHALQNALPTTSPLHTLGL